MNSETKVYGMNEVCLGIASFTMFYILFHLDCNKKILDLFINNIYRNLKIEFGIALTF